MGLLGRKRICLDPQSLLYWCEVNVQIFWPKITLAALWYICTKIQLSALPSLHSHPIPFTEFSYFHINVCSGFRPMIAYRHTYSLCHDRGAYSMFWRESPCIKEITYWCHIDQRVSEPQIPHLGTAHSGSAWSYFRGIGGGVFYPGGGRNMLHIEPYVIRGQNTSKICLKGASSLHLGYW